MAVSWHGIDGEFWKCPVRQNCEVMNDLIYVGSVVAFFVLSGLYVRFCEKL